MKQKYITEKELNRALLIAAEQSEERYKRITSREDKYKNFKHGNYMDRRFLYCVNMETFKMFPYQTIYNKYRYMYYPRKANNSCPCCYLSTLLENIPKKYFSIKKSIYELKLMGTINNDYHCFCILRAAIENNIVKGRGRCLQSWYYDSYRQISVDIRTAINWFTEERLKKNGK